MIAILKKKVVKPLLSCVLPNKLIVWKARPAKEVIALTFDDGPNPQFTPLFLHFLRVHNVKSTFFVIGHAVEQYPDLARQIIREGHEIGNHSFTHNNFSRTKLQNVPDEIWRTQHVIYNATGIRPTLFRPPYGILSLGIMRACVYSDLTVVMWSLDTRDCEVESSDLIRATIGRHPISKGEIVLMHDDNKHMLEALPEFISEQRAQGHQFVTISELLYFHPA